MNNNAEYEIRQGSGWTSISISGALGRDRGEDIRCPECQRSGKFS